MKNTNSTYPNEVIFVRQQNSFNLPKEETEYLVEKRNDFDEIEKLVRFFPVKDGTIELKIVSPEYSKSYKHGDIYSISKKKSAGFSEVEQIVGTGIILNNIFLNFILQKYWFFDYFLDYYQQHEEYKFNIPK